MDRIVDAVSVGRFAAQSQERRREWLAAALLLLVSGCATPPVTQSNQATPVAAKKAVTHATPRPGQGFPQTEDFYPLQSKRLGETGTPDVRACVNADGTLSAPPTLVRTSGSVRLDEAALALAAAGSGHYMPATENGNPVSECFVFRIGFFR
jgi:outer membrane biosynthesis protein TonB